MNQIELIFIVFSAFATVVAGLVLLTGLLFPTMRKRLFMQIILWISFCDFIASFGCTFGFPPGSSFLCPFQSFIVNMFYKASWLWTTALSYQLYSIVIHGQFGLSIVHMHFICWSISLVSTLLPLTTNGIGRDDDLGVGWCFIDGNPVAAQYWFLFSFDFVLLISTFLVIYFLARIYWRYRTMNIQEKYPEVYAILDSLMWYPPGFFITWGPNLLFALLLDFDVLAIDATTLTVFNSLAILATQSGTIVALIYFAKSREARFRWYRLLSTCTGSDSRQRASSASSIEGVSDDTKSKKFLPKTRKSRSVPEDFLDDSRYVRNPMNDDAASASAAASAIPIPASQYGGGSSSPQASASVAGSMASSARSSVGVRGSTANYGDEEGGSERGSEMESEYEMRGSVISDMHSSFCSTDRPSDIHPHSYSARPEFNSVADVGQWQAHAMRLHNDMY